MRIVRITKIAVVSLFLLLLHLPFARAAPQGWSEKVQPSVALSGRATWLAVNHQDGWAKGVWYVAGDGIYQVSFNDTAPMQVFAYTRGSTGTYNDRVRFMGGTTWWCISTTSTSSKYGLYRDGTRVLAQRVADVAYVNGTWYAATGAGLYTSTDGQTWAQADTVPTYALAPWSGTVLKFTKPSGGTYRVVRHDTGAVVWDTGLTGFTTGGGLHLEADSGGYVLALAGQQAPRIIAPGGSVVTLSSLPPGINTAWGWLYWRGASPLPGGGWAVAYSDGINAGVAELRPDGTWGTAWATWPTSDLSGCPPAVDTYGTVWCSTSRASPYAVTRWVRDVDFSEGARTEVVFTPEPSAWRVGQQVTARITVHMPVPIRVQGIWNRELYQNRSIYPSAVYIEYGPEGNTSRASVAALPVGNEVQASFTFQLPWRRCNYVFRAVPPKVRVVWENGSLTTTEIPPW